MALINTTYFPHYSIMTLQNYIFEHIAARLWDLAVVIRKVPDYQANLYHIALHNRFGRRAPCLTLV
jgi:hypothetical protein